MPRPLTPLALLFLLGIVSTSASAPEPAAAPGAAPPRPPETVGAFLRMPDLHGDRVAFVCEDDLWIGSLSGGTAVRLTRDAGAETYPRFSPDGKTLAYTAEYDGRPEIYTIPVSGGAPRRVTYRNDSLQLLDWTPDGQSLVFRSNLFIGGTPVYTVPAAGGYAKRLPLEMGSHLSYAPDGKRFAFTRFRRDFAAWFRYEGGMKNDIWVGDPAALAFRKVYHTTGSNEYPVWAESGICFASDSPEGFTLTSIQPDGKGAKRLAGPYDLEIRNVQTDGKRVIYEKGLGLEVYDPAAGKTAPVRLDLSSDLIHARPFLTPAARSVTFAHLGPTGKRVLVETRGQIVSLPAKDGDVRVVLAKPGVRYRLAFLSPDARRLAYISDETREQQLYVADAEGANPRALTSDRNRQLVGLEWSPDSKWLALTDSETRLRLVEVATGAETEVARGAWWSGPSFAFSPDSRWLAYTEMDRATSFSSLVLYEIASGGKTPVGAGMTDDYAPAFSPDGKWLAFLSRRNVEPRFDGFLNQLTTENPTRVYLLALKKETRSPFLPESDEEKPQPEAADKPAETKDAKPAEKPAAQPAAIEIDGDGLAERFIEVPVAAANYTSLAMAGDRIFMLAPRSAPNSGAALTYYDIKAKKAGAVAENLGGFQVSGDGKKLLLSGVGGQGAGPVLRVVDITAADVKATDPAVDFAGFMLRINPQAEWENMYWDAWRLIRDYFYVANLHGADWPAVGKKYAALLPSVRSRGELNELLRWMLAELNISHAHAVGGDRRVEARPLPTPAFLGIDVEPDPSGFYKISRILRGEGFSEAERSPLAAPGVNVAEGHYLIEVAGVPAKEGEDFLQGLVGRAGQVVTVKVNDRPTPEGARTVRVRPIANERRLRYLEWVKGRRDYVRKAAQGRLGYIHLNAMGDADMADFIRQYFPQRGREAMVMDLRFNGGGYISTFVINVLKQRVAAYFNQRANPQPWTRQSEFFSGPMACLINEFSGSNGEEFPHHFRSLGLGPLIGRRTWGGEVGSDPGWPLADGGLVYVPNYGAWTPKDGWIIEGKGVSPDYDVESDPNAWARGKDPQLDKTIDLLLAELKKNPVPRPVQPPDPVRVRPRAPAVAGN